MKNHGIQTQPHDTESKHVLNPPKTDTRTEHSLQVGELIVYFLISLLINIFLIQTDSQTKRWNLLHKPIIARWRHYLT